MHREVQPQVNETMGEISQAERSEMPAAAKARKKAMQSINFDMTKSDLQPNNNILKCKQYARAQQEINRTFLAIQYFTLHINQQWETPLSSSSWAE